MIALLAFGAMAANAKSIEVTVHPNNSNGLHCQVGPKTMPVEINQGYIDLQVGVKGTRGDVQWRIPFGEYHNGANRVQLAEIGSAKLDRQGTFLISVEAGRLASAAREGAVRVQLTASNGKRTVCYSDVNVLAKALSPSTASVR